MGIKQKFFALAAGIAVLVAIISGVGYYTAYSNLQESVENEIAATMGEQEKSLSSWLLVKKRLSMSAANFMESQDGKTVTNDMLSMAADDKEVLTMAFGNEMGQIVTYADGDLTGLVDPRTRDWYKQAKSTDKPYWTAAYQDAITKKLVVTISAPYHNKSNALAGVICEDIALDTLDEVAKNIKPSARGEYEITTVNQQFLTDGELKVQTLGRGFAWLDTGTFDSLSEASTYIEVLEKRQGLKVGCLEGIAYHKGWIDEERMRQLAQPMLKNQYGQYLLKVIEDVKRFGLDDSDL